MADEVNQEAPTTAAGALSGIQTITKLLVALAGLVTAGSAVYVAIPKSTPAAPATTASVQASVPQAPTRSYIQLASFGTKEDAMVAAGRQAKDLLRQVCVYESRDAFATALGPMLTADAEDMVKPVSEHPTVHRGALVVAGKTYVAVGACYGGAK